MKKIMMIVAIAASMAGFGQTTNTVDQASKWYPMYLKTHQYVGFELVNGYALQPESEDEMRVSMKLINKTNSNTNAVSYTVAELKRMFGNFLGNKDLDVTMDEYFEFWEVDTSKGMFVLRSKKFSELVR